MPTFQCDIVSAEAALLSCEAELVTARSLDGELGIYANHQPILGALQVAPLTVHEEGGTVHHFAVHHGFLFFQDNKLVVLADLAESQADIDAGRAERRLQEREQMEAAEDREQAIVQTSIAKQRARLTVAGR